MKTYRCLQSWGMVSRNDYLLKVLGSSPVGGLWLWGTFVLKVFIVVQSENDQFSTHAVSLDADLTAIGRTSSPPITCASTCAHLWLIRCEGERDSHCLCLCKRAGNESISQTACEEKKCTSTECKCPTQIGLNNTISLDSASPRLSAVKDCLLCCFSPTKDHLKWESRVCVCVWKSKNDKGEWKGLEGNSIYSASMVGSKQAYLYGAAKTQLKWSVHVGACLCEIGRVKEEDEGKKDKGWDCVQCTSLQKTV